MTVNVCGFRDTPKDKTVINTTSRSTTWNRGLSPFFCGPVDLYDIYTAKNVENAWQYAKVYSEHIDWESDDERPSESYFTWAQWGWNKTTADRYPMGKGRKPMYSYWNGEKLSYIEARRKIYAPIYAKAVEKTEAFAKLKEVYSSGEEIWLWDFDGYDFRSKGMTYEEVLLNEKRKMGHAFVLAMMLEGERVWEKQF